MPSQNPDSKAIVPNTSGETTQGLPNSTITASPDYRMEPEVRPSWAIQGLPNSTTEAPLVVEIGKEVTKDGLSNSTITAPPNHEIGSKVHPSWAHQETGENLVATIVDITSIMVAYRLGMDQYGIVSALGYAAFDAYIVIWQRKRLARWVHKLITFISS